ncbi:MAG: hypothetical protein ABSH46_06580 [Bryobacteraceae bacterium]|jgi:hypothetical protein
MASPKRNANRRKFNRQPLDVDDLTSASSFSGIRDVIESHFGKSENADQAAEAGGGEGPRNVEADPEHPQYVWEPKGVPFSVRLDADVIGRLEKESLDIFRAITNRGSEIGGILLGEVLPGWPVSVVVRDYEPVPCAYTLGPSYLLSDEEQERLGEAIETRQKASGLTVVGFFRSNTRPALVLQDDDLDLFEEFFPEDHNIFVLAKPFSRKPCQGAIYVREGGKIRTDSSPLEFAFSRAELEKLGALQPGLRLASQPSRLGPASSPDRAPAIPIDSAPAEFKRPPAPVVLKPEPPSPVETKPAPSAIGTGTEPPAAPVRTEPKIEPRVEPRAEPPLEQRIEARLPWLKPSSPPPAPRPAAPPSESAGTTTPASPARPLFTPPPRVETRATPPEPPSPPPAARPAAPPAASARTTTPASPARPLFTPPPRVETRATPPEPPSPPPAARPAAPPSASARTSTPASPVRPLFTPPRVETRATPPEPPSPPPAARPAAPPAESAGTSTPANPARPLFTPPPKVETVATPTPEPPSPPRFSARIQSRIPPSVQPRIATNLGSKPAPGAGPAQPTRFMTRMEPRTAPQQPKPEPKPEATLAPKVEPAVPPQPAVRIEPVVVVRPPAQPRAEVEAEPKVEPKAEVKVEPRVEPPSPRFTRIQPGVQPRPEPEPQPAAPPADDLQSVFRRKPEQGPPPQTAPSFGYDEEAAQGKHRWILPVVIALVIVVVGVYFFVIRPNRQTVEEAPAAAAQLPAHRQAVDLPLRVEGFEGALTIFWDGLAAPISTAPRGVLSIRDGAGTKTFDLTSDELKKGTYGYKPRTDDVLVRLELKGLPGGQSAYGVTHIFGARRLGKTSAK